MKNHIILLNSPPASGKDTTAGIISALDGSYKKEFKEPMYKIASAMVGLTVKQFLEVYSDREKKENPCEEFLGMSGRQLLIDISESFCKPRFGVEYFGKVAANTMTIEEFRDWGYVFSDSGFLTEVSPLARKFGAENITIVQFTGRGVTKFGGDSRSWVDGSSLGVRTIRLEKSNDDVTPLQFGQYVMDTVADAISAKV